MEIHTIENGTDSLINKTQPVEYRKIIKIRPCLELNGEQVDDDERLKQSIQVEFNVRDIFDCFKEIDDRVIDEYNLEQKLAKSEMERIPSVDSRLCPTLDFSQTLTH